MDHCKITDIEEVHGIMTTFRLVKTSWGRWRDRLGVHPHGASSFGHETSCLGLAWPKASRAVLVSIASDGKVTFTHSPYRGIAVTAELPKRVVRGELVRTKRGLHCLRLVFDDDSTEDVMAKVAGKDETLRDMKILRDCINSFLDVAEANRSSLDVERLEQVPVGRMMDVMSESSMSGTPLTAPQLGL